MRVACQACLEVLVTPTEPNLFLSREADIVLVEVEPDVEVG